MSEAVGGIKGVCLSVCCDMRSSKRPHGSGGERPDEACFHCMDVWRRTPTLGERVDDAVLLQVSAELLLLRIGRLFEGCKRVVVL